MYLKGSFYILRFFWAKFHQLTDKKKKAQCDLYKGFLLKIFKKISYFLEKIYNSPDLHSQLVYLA